MALTLPSKVFFLIFILLMALVFMNLLLGLAVSDIAELERVSCVSDQIFYTQTFPLPHRNLIKKGKQKNLLIQTGVCYRNKAETGFIFSDPDSHDDLSHDNDD